ncbi:recombinase family protein [Streptomyces sp. NPDC048275]|uniref:recombinase family protein n=1 Tax=Streptomyces sp. NPDC048275 TaxID=3155629 RepID=UPI0033FDF31E
MKSPRGKEWSTQSLRGVLLSPRIAGRVAHQGEDVGPAQWDPIIDRGTWLAVRTVLTDTARRSGNEIAREPKYLGSGISQAQAAAAREPGPLAVLDLPELARRYEADPDDALAWWRRTYFLARRRKILDALAVVTLRPGRRGRPVGVAAGGVDPQSVDIEWSE